MSCDNKRLSRISVFKAFGNMRVLTRFIKLQLEKIAAVNIHLAVVLGHVALDVQSGKLFVSQCFLAKLTRLCSQLVTICLQEV